MYLSLLGVFVFTFFRLSAFAQSGILDATFGSGGKVITSTPDSLPFQNIVWSMALQTDGKIVCAGITSISNVLNLVLLRYNTNGSLDNSFGANGRVLINDNIPAIADGIQKAYVAIQPDGKIVASHPVGDFLVERFNTDGSPDLAFGVNGKARTNLGGEEEHTRSVVVKSNGKILLSGMIVNNGINMDWGIYLLQYNSDGTPDVSFGTNGVAYYRQWAEELTMVIQPNQKILVTGRLIDTLAGNTIFGLLRFNTNGTIDNTFGTAGTATLPAVGQDFGRGIAVQPDGKILLTGDAYNVQSFIRIARFTVSGMPDATFGNNGEILLAPSSNGNLANNVNVQADGKIIVAGTMNFQANMGTSDFFILRLLPNGTTDMSFGTNGEVSTDFLNSDIAFVTAIQPDGKIVVGGVSNYYGNSKFALARYKSGALPLKLLNFIAMRDGKTNRLQWSTSQEINVDRFEVERSNDGREFVRMQNVKCKMQNGGSYDFTDPSPLTPHNYYRLKIVDKDGKFEYSPVRMVNNSSTFSVNIYPNPAKDNLQVQIDSDKKMTLQMQVVFLEGKLILSNTTIANEGSNLRSININAMPKGSYILKVITAEKEEQVVKFEKL